MTVNTCGRTDIDELLSESGILTYTKLKHTPFLVFLESNGDVRVILVDSAKKLRAFPLDTKIMVQWKGQWESNFFQLTVGDVVSRLKE